MVVAAAMVERGLIALPHPKNRTRAGNLCGHRFGNSSCRPPALLKPLTISRLRSRAGAYVGLYAAVQRGEKARAGKLDNAAGS
jgi:hypothetical protein